MMTETSSPCLVLTVALDAGARAAAVTRSHADAYERAQRAAQGHAIAALELIELPVPPRLFAELRRCLGLEPSVVGLYDLFPLPAHLQPELRRVAGQFLAAERLWTLGNEDEALAEALLDLHLELPPGWEHDPRKIRDRLVQAGALDIPAEAVETFRRIKERWDGGAPAAERPAEASAGA